jgi:hypothetical protein
MSLKDAVLGVANELEHQSKLVFEMDPSEKGLDLLSMKMEAWSKQLRIACLAASDPPPPAVLSQGTICVYCGKAGEHAAWCQTIINRKEAQKVAPVVEQENLTSGMAVCVGKDGMEPTTVSVDGIPQGAFVPVPGEGVFKLEGQKLVFSPEQTERWKKERGMK